MEKWLRILKSLADEDFMKMFKKFLKNYRAIFQTFWTKFDKILCVERPKWKKILHVCRNNVRNLMLEKICQFEKI